MAITLTLCILLAAVMLFATEWLPMDVVAMLILLALAITGMVSVPEALSGFSNPAVITVAAMFVISAGITHTGALGKAGKHFIRLAGGSETRLTVIIMASVAVFSAFINNIGATAVLMPVIIEICRRMHVSPSKMLIPLAYGSLLGGVCTLVGTPPNILMNALLYEYTGERFGLFSFSPLGIVLVIVGISYMTLVGRRMLPTRKSEKLTEAYQVKEYITQVEILEDSPMAGQTIAGSSLERDFQLRVRAILRGREKFPQPRRNRKLRVGDILFLEGNPQGIIKVMAAKGLQLIPERAELLPRRGKELLVVEASLTPNSDMVGKTLRQVHFRETYNLNVLALWRQGAPVVKKVDHVVLRFGDVLLLQGDDTGIMHLGRQHGFLLLGGVEPVPYRPRQAPMALLVLAGVILLTTTETLPIALAAPFGAVAMVLSRCLTVQEAYESIDWRIILLIAGTLPLGLALENSGAASLLAERMLQLVGSWGPYAVLAAFFLLTSVLTEVMSHAATAVVIAPIALHAALTLQVSPRPFFMAVAVAASSCFMTPISHQSNALVMGPGGYRFADFMRTGALLNLLVWVCACLLIPWLFPF